MNDRADRLLAEAREIVTRALDRGPNFFDPDDGHRLARLFYELDEAIIRGKSYPRDWQRGERPPRPSRR